MDSSLVLRLPRQGLQPFLHIIAGTRIHEALQDPSLPEDLDIRRNNLRFL